MSGLVSHIIPYSVQGSGAIDFWKLISLFSGNAETAALRAAALGTGNRTDVLLNVWWVWDGVHTVFDKGHITVNPDLTTLEFPYDPDEVTNVWPHSVPAAHIHTNVTSQYHAIVEFSIGSRIIALPILTPSTDPLDPDVRQVTRARRPTHVLYPRREMAALATPSAVAAARNLLAHAGRQSRCWVLSFGRFGDDEVAEYLLVEHVDESESESEGEEEPTDKVINDVAGWLRELRTRPG